MRKAGENKRISVNNLKVSYTDLGSEDHHTIVFIHGFPFDKTMWNKQLDALQDNYRVIAYDIRGFGDSYPSASDYSIALFANDLINLLDALKIEKAIVCGLSMGGYIALNAISRFPERFEALILSDTNCIADTPEIKTKRLLAIEQIMENGVEKYVEASLKNFFAAESFMTKVDEIERVKTMMMHTSKTTLCKTLVAMSNRKETASTLGQIKVPVHLLVGNQDIITPLSNAQYMNEQIKDASLSVISEAGHLANIDNPLEFNDQLKKFADWFAQSCLEYESVELNSEQSL